MRRAILSGVLTVLSFCFLVATAFAQAPRTIGCAASYAGNHDSASCQLADGWAWDSTQPNTPISVDVLVDGSTYRTLLANVFRTDLVTAGIGNGIHGFRFVVPTALKNSTAHSIRVRVAGTSFDLNGTPKAITCAPPTGNFYTVAPCRVLDTTGAPGPLGGPALAAGATRFFPISSSCGIPSTAEAISLNVTTVNSTAAGALHIFPDGLAAVPSATAISYAAAARADNGVIALGAGSLGIYCEQPSGTVDVIIDVNGYFN